MKTTALLLFLTAFWSRSATAQCPTPGFFVLTTQAAVDAFQTNYPNCATIDGTLIIAGADIDNLDQLFSLTSITGQLVIVSTSNLDDLDGLVNVATIGGSVNIENNAAMADLSGLGGVTSIGGEFHIIGNGASLTSLNGLNPLLTLLSNYLLIQNNAGLTSLAGLGNITTMSAGLTVAGNSNMTSFAGLSAGLSTIGGNFAFGNNNLSSPINIPPTLTTISGNLTIGAFSIGEGGITSLAGLGNISSVGSLLVIGNPNLTSLAGLSASLTSVPGQIYISTNPSLGNLSGLGNITTLGGDLGVVGNGGLTSLAGLNAALTTVAGYLTIQQNNGLDDLAGLDNITSVGGVLKIVQESGLLNLSGLGVVASIGQGLEIEGNPALLDLNGLAQLTSLGNHLSINNNAALTSLGGLSNLATFTSDWISINNNAALTSLGGFGVPGLALPPTMSLQLENSSMLAVCEIRCICDFLNNGGTSLISGNASGCSNETEVLEACACNWIGNAGNWNVSGNWSCGHVPTSNDRTVISNGTVALDMTRTVQRLTMSGGFLNCGAFDLTLTGNLVWSGGTISGTGDLTVQGTTNVSNAPILAGMTVASSSPFSNSGTFNIQSGAFDVNGDFCNTGIIGGNGTLDISDAVVSCMGDFAPGTSPGLLNIEGPYANGGGNLVIELGGTAPAQYDRLVVNGAATLAGGAIQLSLVNAFVPAVTNTFTIFDALSLSGTFSTPADPFVFAGLNWDIAYNAGAGTIILTAESVVLPLELLDFEAFTNEKNTLLTWRTASETNFSHFEIERSADEKGWSKIGSLDGLGSPEIEKAYQFADRQLLPLAFYRLRMVDADGSAEFSPIIAAKRPGLADRLEISPNPFSEKLHINLRAQGEATAFFSLSDLTGKTIWQTSTDIKSGENTLSFDLKALPAGLYFLKIQADGWVAEKRAIKI